jgi:putative DNA-invertase from lambdoid prophage Rac
VQRQIEEIISGSVAAKERPGFIKLIDRMEPGEVLVVTKLDRLGRNAMDVRATIEQLASSGVRVHCLALGGVDLASPAGKITLQIIAAVADSHSRVERSLLIERTQDAGASIAEIAREFKTTRQTLMRVKRSCIETTAKWVSFLHIPMESNTE